MTRRLQLKAMREAAATVKAFAESDTGRELRETVRRFSESDIAKEIREAAKSFPVVDRSALAAAAEARKPLVGMLETEEEATAPAPRRRNKGGRPAYHDWIGAKAHLDDWVLRNGLPPAKRELARIAIEWFKSVDGGAAPHRRDIMKKLINPFYA
jgi:hypothetical protein